MPYIITRVGSGLKLVDSAGDSRLFSDPSLRISAQTIFNASAPGIRISQDSDSVNLTLADVTTVNGAVPAGTLPGLLDQLQAIPSGNLTVSTLAAGATYAAFGAQVCSSLTIANATGVAIDVQQGGAGAPLTLPTGGIVTLSGITNASQIAVRRNDVGVAVVIVTARYVA